MDGETAGWARGEQLWNQLLIREDDGYDLARMKAFLDDKKFKDVPGSCMQDCKDLVWMVAACKNELGVLYDDPNGTSGTAHERDVAIPEKVGVVLNVDEKPVMHRGYDGKRLEKMSERMETARRSFADHDTFYTRLLKNEGEFALIRESEIKQLEQRLEVEQDAWVKKLSEMPERIQAQKTEDAIKEQKRQLGASQGAQLQHLKKASVAEQVSNMAIEIVSHNEYVREHNAGKRQKKE
tara:strand:- start:104 stop:817 length:714 start_codon:yes stop_codon:yes gene_type:complete